MLDIVSRSSRAVVAHCLCQHRPTAVGSRKSSSRVIILAWLRNSDGGRIRANKSGILGLHGDGKHQGVSRWQGLTTGWNREVCVCVAKEEESDNGFVSSKM